MDVCPVKQYLLQCHASNHEETMKGGTRGITAAKTFSSSGDLLRSFVASFFVDIQHFGFHQSFGYLYALCALLTAKYSHTAYSGRASNNHSKGCQQGR
jgi:hypothetical protein